MEESASKRLRVGGAPALVHANHPLASHISAWPSPATAQQYVQSMSPRTHQHGLYQQLPPQGPPLITHPQYSQHPVQFYPQQPVYHHPHQHASPYPPQYQAAAASISLPALHPGHGFVPITQTPAAPPRPRTPPSPAGSDVLGEEELKLRRRIDASCKRTLNTKAKAAPAPSKRKRAAAPRKTKPKDKDFTKLLEKVETAMGFSGGDRNGMDVEHRLGKYSDTMMAAMVEPETTWTTKKNVVAGIIHIFMAILCAPAGKCARHNRNFHLFLARNFLKSVDHLTVDERKRLALDEDFMLDLEGLYKEAKDYAAADSMNVTAVKQRLRDAVEPPVITVEDGDDDGDRVVGSSRSGSPSSSSSAVRERDGSSATVSSPMTIPDDAPSPKRNSSSPGSKNDTTTFSSFDETARNYRTYQPPAPKPKPPLGRAPWYPLTCNNIVVSETYALPAPLPADADTTPLPDESFDQYSGTLREELGYGGKHSRVTSEKTLEARASAIADNAYRWAGDILQAASKQRASEGTRINAANTLLRMCDLIDGDGPFNTSMVREYVRAYSMKIDQYLMRLVQRLGVEERRKLAGWKEQRAYGEGQEFLVRLEDLMRYTRRHRTMKSLEVVRDMLLEAKLQAE